jgi:hypothetical protein
VADTPEILATAPLPDAPIPEAQAGATAATGASFLVPEFQSVTDLEKWLRQRGGFSRRQAVAVVAEAKACFEREAKAKQGDSQVVIDALRALSEQLRP